MGIYLFGVGAYLGFAPSVYFFAKRQRESIRWTEAVAVALVFLILLGSLSVGIAGLVRFKSSLEEQAHQFADGAFRSIFKEHDTYFLLDHASQALMQSAHGRGGLTRFLQGAYIQAGDVDEIQRAGGSFRLIFSFPFHVGGEAEMISEGKGAHGRVRMRMLVIDSDGDWAIQGIRWSYY